ncbi:MAG: site-2 protease family protein [Eubacteriaceae bacterium]|nr:site-2 protease family protein [Eubacteriaceae bacterium]
MGSLANNLTNMIASLPAIIVAITFHEVAHGYAAEAMGDDTAARARRLSLNPLKHIDPLGLLSMILFRFGWAKPVPINPNNFKDRRKGVLLVSLAGCGTNLILAFISLAVITVVQGFATPLLNQILYSFYIYNLIFGIFNLLPIPPLDGSHVLEQFLPPRARMVYNQYARYGMFLLILMLWTGMIGGIIWPAINIADRFYKFLLAPLTGWF